MSMKWTVSRWLLWISAALLASPGLAAAQNAVLYEVTETMKIKVRDGETGNRQATASLMGTIKAGTSLCPAAFARALKTNRCFVVAAASSDMSVRSLRGRVNGQFSVVVQGDNRVDGDELEVAKGYMGGRIDLSPVLNGWPVGALEGTWSAKGAKGGPLAGLKLEGTVVGTFRLPFVFGLPDGCLDDADPSDCWYVSDPSYMVGSGPVPLRPAEYSLGVPTVRLELTFTETARRRLSRDRDDD